ncbi:S8 family serine peptidase [Xanthomonas sontii]|uniref:S8 family serine peptidase n=1 Tax=Xanthomonas sontii TaxID=2650745 RepID=A0A6N7QDM5_9XANT|nr:S8 family serine peptidase [Xanthomonas sontii]MRG98971.1 S8 family serine peptidase [Xanthomonas sontii]MRH73238.1 S8 family serine peptidase [Xanthomonas sontii]
MRCQWDRALFGRAMGERTRMAYWVNRERYPSPEPGDCQDQDRGPVLNQAEQRMLSALGVAPQLADLRQLADTLAASDAERARLHQVLNEVEAARAPAAAAADVHAQGVVDVLNRALLKLISAALLQDVHDFFFVPARRTQMRESLLQRIRAGGGPFVVIAHSQGSLIAYDVLRELQPQDCEVSLLLTLGSPLGLPVVRSMFKEWTGTPKLPFPPCVARWVNVAERRDPVALDDDLNDDIADAGGRFHNIAGSKINPDWQHNPHSAAGYLSIPDVRAEVRRAVGVGFDQPIAHPVLIKDLSDQLEARAPDYRHEVLIELERLSDVGDPAQRKHELIAALRTLTEASTGLHGEALDAQIELEDTLQRYVSARLTRFEIESLRERYRDLNLKRLWRDAGKRALIYQSRSTIQVDAAQVAYRALGSGIGWAVLDSGIAAAHPHFHAAGQPATVLAQWDCTQRGRPRALRPGEAGFDTLDGNGHGTHVAGIIAGQCEAPLPGVPTTAPLQFAGMAPLARLYGLKVLDDDGNGRDSWIIKGVQQVAELNERAGELVVHGVNLSLGGYFDAESYGCGFTPLCNELRRLWRQGVVVVIAAGNDGLAWLMQGDGEAYPLNLDLSIGDPANLEESLAVGSVHKSSPHSYGISYFSSRGPTADGRYKPDLVAPGEKILSAHHGYALEDPGTWMVEMSGTSMAAAHVSGLIAAFLSVRREFIGAPDRVKQLVLAQCLDLQRDRYMQGSGLPSLMRMLGGT